MQRLNIIESESIAIALDIDQCALVGNDANDLMRMLQMETDYEDTDRKLFLDVLKCCINPALKAMVDDFVLDHGYRPRLLLYTQRGKVVQQFRKTQAEISKRVPQRHIHYEDRNSDRITEVHFDRHDCVADGPKYIWQQFDCADFALDEARVIYRLSAVAWAVSDALGYDYIPPVVITVREKDLHIIADMFPELYSFDTLYLYDDKARKHAEALEESLEEAHMLPVEPFEFRHLSWKNATKIETLLAEHLPVVQIKNPFLRHQISVAAEGWPADRLLIVDNAWRIRSAAPAAYPPWPRYSGYTQGRCCIKACDAKTQRTKDAAAPTI